MATINVSLDDLMAFHQVALNGNFTLAAKGSAASKAGLSRQVRRLEMSLGTQLFHRTTRKVHLTEAGNALLAYSHRISEISAEATRRLEDLKGEAAGPIRLSMPVSFGEVFGPSFLLAMKKAAPNLRVELDLSNENRDFLKDGIDFALRATENHHPDLIARHLGRMKDVVCAAPGLHDPAKIKDPRQLTRLECITHSNQEWNSWNLSSQTRDVSTKVKGKFSTSQYGVAKNLCLAGLGIARLPYYLVEEDLAKGTLVRLLADYEISTHPLYIVYLKSEYPSRRHSLTRDLLLSWFKTRPEIFL